MVASMKEGKVLGWRKYLRAVLLKWECLCEIAPDPGDKAFFMELSLLKVLICSKSFSDHFLWITEPLASVRSILPPDCRLWA
jgi:hypothetical protein